MELLVVLLILGTTGAVVLPAFRPTEERRVARAAEQLAGAYEAARDAAITRGALVSVTLEHATGRYSLVARAPLGGAPDTLHLDSLQLPPGARIRGPAGGWTTAVFDPLGHARADRVLLLEGEARHDVVVDFWTATPRVERR